MTWYGVLKVVHVLSVVAWIGGGAALGLMTARLARAGDRGSLAALLPQMRRYVQTIAAPATGLVLLSGIAMMVVGQLGFDALWVRWGFAGIVVHLLFGPLVMRRLMGRLADATMSSPANDAGLARAGTRLLQGNLAYLLIMTSVIAMMVLKPV